MTEIQKQTRKSAGGIKTFRDLVVWQKGYQLALNVYQATSGFPGSERFGLTSQMRRCASSVPANIAEGFGRHRRKEFVRFLQIAQGSLFEIETYTCLAADLKYLSDEWAGKLEEDAAEVERILSALIRSVKQREKSS